MLIANLIKEVDSLNIRCNKEVNMNNDMTPERLEILRIELDRPSLKNLKNYKDIVGVEVGVQYGINARDILLKYDIKTLYLVDPYSVYPLASGAGFTKHNEEIKRIAHEYLKEFESRIIWIEEFSWDAVNMIPDNLDFAYIDGDHRKEAVEKDLRFYYPKVRNGGLFCGHDYIRYRAPGVVEAVDEFFKDKEKVFSGGKWDWWIFKE